MSKHDYDFVMQHGGFSQGSWEVIAHLIGEWMDHRRLGPADAFVTVDLANGRSLAIEAVRAGVGWVVLLTEDDSMELVPHTQVIGVRVRRRPQRAPERTIGFHAEAVTAQPTQTPS